MLEELLVENGAPTLSCIKCANLMTARFTNRVQLARQVAALRLRLRQYGVQLTILRLRDGCAQLYLYRPQLVSAILERQAVRDFLRGCGYTDLRLSEALKLLRRRLESGEDFPHEIGIFLGYPLEDVQAFIEKHGQDCVLCGMWKVYHNEQEARRYFASCHDCRLRAIRAFRAGMSLEQLTVAA